MSAPTSDTEIRETLRAMFDPNIGGCEPSTLSEILEVLDERAGLGRPVSVDELHDALVALLVEGFLTHEVNPSTRKVRFKKA